MIEQYIQNLNLDELKLFVQKWIDQTLKLDIPILIFLEDKIVFVNNELAKLLGYNNTEDLLNKTIFDLVHEDEREQLKTKLKVIKCGFNSIILDDVNGLSHQIKFYCFQTQIDDKVYIFVLLLDFLDFKKIKRNQKKLTQLVRFESLTKMSGGIAHAFNNYLLGIIGNANLALLDNENPKIVIEAVNEILSISKQASKLSNKMLALSGRGKFELNYMNPTEFIKENQNIFEISIDQKVPIKYELEEELPSTLMDLNQINDVIIYILVNATESIKEKNIKGKIIIRTGKTKINTKDIENLFYGENFKPGEYVYFEVIDNGVGIKQIHMNSLFDPFFTTKEYGEGLSLSVALGSILGHKGAIHVTSDELTSFKILLPIANQKEDKIKLNKTVSNISAKKGKILVCDDESYVVSIVTRMLKRMHFDTFEAFNGQEAINIVNEKGDKIALIILDITMPMMGGIEALHKIRKINPNIPILLSSGYNEEEITPQIVNDYNVWFLHKPYTYDEFSNKLQEILGDD